MSLIDDLANAPENARRTPPRHPDGWEPGVEWNGRTGQITAQWDHKVPDWRALLQMWDFDPEQYEIVDDTVELRSWDAAIGNNEVRRMYYHRAKLRQKRKGGADLASLIADIRKHKPRRVGNGLSDTVVVGGAYFLALNDWQAGKKNTKATVERILAASDASVRRIAELRKAGRQIDTIVLAGIGDLVEQCDGHYPGQRFETELNMREQRNLVRWLITHIIKAHAPLAPRLTVGCAAGNHGEARVDGKQVTGQGDNSDLEVFEGVRDALAENPAAYGHVKFLIPRDELTLTLQPIADGPILCLAHGHQARKGGTAQQKVATWLAGQAFGFRAAGDASITIVGHFHQFAVNDNGGRTIFIAPTIDSGSQWFAETAGLDSTPGMLSFLITQRGWSDVQIL